METIIKKSKISALKDLEILLMKAEINNDIVPELVYEIVHKLRALYEQE